VALPSSYPTPNPELERLRGWVSQYFPVYEARITPNSLLLLVHADPTTLEERFDRLRQELWPKQYVPQIRYDRGEYVVEIVRRPPRSTWGPWVNILLLALTGVTTVTAGAIFWLAYRGGVTLSGGDFLYGGLFFGVPLMAILGFHELAHYVLARHHHVEASLPYFLPVPPPYLLFGTFGAFISLRQPIPSKKALLDIGAAGPLAGFAVSIPVTIGGLFLSTQAHALALTNCGPVVVGVPFGNLLIGPSFLWYLLSLFVPGPIRNLHPLALAGWVGLLVTSMNLLPAGQLDGGHVFRALFGKRSTYVSIAAVLVLFFLGFFFYPGWLIFALLIFLLGVRHPPPLNDLSRLDLKRWGVGAVTLIVLIGGFVIVPISMPSGQFGIVDHTWAHLGGAPPGGMADAMNLTVEDQDVVPYGFVLTGTVTAAGSPSGPLLGGNFTQFADNSSWTVILPNGNSSSFPTNSSFTIPNAGYARIGAGESAMFQVWFQNPSQAAVTVELSVRPLCVSGASPQTETYFID
jgi:hypothetical protein